MSGWRSIASIARGLAGVALALALGGCATLVPRDVPAGAEAASKAVIAGLPAVRFWGDEVPANAVAEVARRLNGTTRLAASRTTTPEGRPIVEILALSGGGPDGAFGAGLLAGWTARGDRPEFEVVTGVSAGAIIAPFAFLGRRYDATLRAIWTEYETSQIIVAQLVPAIFGAPALADTAPLAALIARYVDRRLLRAIAREAARGRMLLVGTTNLDAQRPVVWNLGAIAAHDSEQALELFRRVILASAAIPGAFPPVMIEVESEGRRVEEMHVDGGVTREVFVAPVQLDLRHFDRFYAQPPLRRIYVLKNGKLEPEFEAVQPTAISIGARAIATLIKSQNYGDINRIWQLAQSSKAEFNLSAVPTTFRIEEREAFDPVYQQALYDVGFGIGKAGGNWQHLPPELSGRPAVR